jgi:hypothetical protein
LHLHAVPFEVPAPLLLVGHVKQLPFERTICLAKLHVVLVHIPPVVFPIQKSATLQPQEVFVAAYPFD